MTGIRTSLYDLFGYLFPGTIVILAVRLLIWVCFYPQLSLTVEPLNNIVVISLLIGLSYVAGHILHSIGNFLPATRSTRMIEPNAKNIFQRILKRKTISLTAAKLVDETIKEKLGIQYLALESEEKFSLLDEARSFTEKENDREVYIYHEGFYRGMTIACSILFLSLLVSFFVKDLTIISGKMHFIVIKKERVVLAIAAVVATIGFWKRMTRFSHYRITRAVMRWFIFINNIKNLNE